MEDDYEYRLNDPGETTLAEKERKKRQNQAIIFISNIVILSLISIGVIILYFKKNEKDTKNNEGKEMSQNYYLYLNISTS